MDTKQLIRDIIVFSIPRHHLTRPSVTIMWTCGLNSSWDRMYAIRQWYPVLYAFPGIHCTHWASSINPFSNPCDGGGQLRNPSSIVNTMCRWIVWYMSSETISLHVDSPQPHRLGKPPCSESDMLHIMTPFANKQPKPFLDISTISKLFLLRLMPPANPLHTLQGNPSGLPYQRKWREDLSISILPSVEQKANAWNYRQYRILLAQKLIEPFTTKKPGKFPSFLFLFFL